MPRIGRELKGWRCCECGELSGTKFVHVDSFLLLCPSLSVCIWSSRVLLTRGVLGNDVNSAESEVPGDCGLC